MNDQWLILSACLAPALVGMAVLWLWRWKVARVPQRHPIAEKLLRSPGETLRKRLEGVEEAFNDRLVLLLLLPFVVAVVSLSAKVKSQLVLTIVLMTPAALGCVWLIRELVRLLKEVRKLRLGFHGERAVGEELNQLMLTGYRVFHDVPIEPYENIDHVVVAASGVYAVETKTKRKRPSLEGKRDYEIVFDGQALQFPHGRFDLKAVEQANRQADLLRKWLASATADDVPVAAILTLPGWWVTSRVKPDRFAVLNPRRIGEFIGHRKPILSPEQIQRIVHQLDQKCRDVEL